MVDRESWTALFTKHITQKRKTWFDGFVSVLDSRFTLFSEGRAAFSPTLAKSLIQVYTPQEGKALLSERLGRTFISESGARIEEGGLLIELQDPCSQIPGQDPAEEESSEGPRDHATSNAHMQLQPEIRASTGMWAPRPLASLPQTGPSHGWPLGAKTLLAKSAPVAQPEGRKPSVPILSAAPMEGPSIQPLLRSSKKTGTGYRYRLH